MDLDFVLVHKHELGQYPAILTSHLVNNPYLMPYFNYFSPVLSDKLQKLQNGAARIHEEGFSRKTSASFRFLKISIPVTPSQRDMSTQKAASQWNNRTPNFYTHSERTRFKPSGQQ